MRVWLFITIALLAVACGVAGCEGSLLIPRQKVATVIETQINSPTPINVYFPRRGDEADKVLIALCIKAASNLDIAIYSLTDPNIVGAIKDAKARGVSVRVISDDGQSSGASGKAAINNLLGVGIPVKINSHSGLMHLKMTIVDGLIATTGSYNYSAAARDHNDEMLVVISDVTFVKECQKEFDRLWNSPVGFINATTSY